MLQQRQFRSLAAEDADAYAKLRDAAADGVCDTCIAALEAASYRSSKDLLRMLAFVMACRADMAAQVLHEQKQVTAAVHAAHALDRAQLAGVRRGLPRLFLLLKLFQKQLIATQLERDRQAAQLAAMQQERDSQAAQLAATQLERDSLAAMQQERDRQAAQLAAMQQERDRQAAQLAAMQQERDRQAAQMAALLLKQRNQAAQLSDLQGVRDRLAAQLEATRSELTRQLVTLQRERDQLMQQQKASQETCDQLSRQLLAVKSELSAVKSELLAVQSELSAVQSELSAVQSELSEMQSEHRRLRAAAATQQQLSDTQSALHSAQVALHGAQAEHAELAVELAQLRQEASGARNFIERLSGVTVDGLGSVIAKEVAAAQMVAATPNRCASCNEPATLRCCSAVYYCSKVCQKANFKLHDGVCERKLKTAIDAVESGKQELQVRTAAVLRLSDPSRLPERLRALLDMVLQVRICQEHFKAARARGANIADEKAMVDRHLEQACADCQTWIFTVISRLPTKLHSHLSELDNFARAVNSGGVEETAATFAVIGQICTVIDQSGRKNTLLSVFTKAIEQLGDR
jgi:myosin heavy subunit